MTTPFEQAVQAIYQVHPHHFFPYVGARYLDPDPSALRVMALGINAYVGDAEWAHYGTDPTRFASWFVNARYRYQRRVLKDLEVLAPALLSGGMFAGRQFHGRASVYATNAIKTYLLMSKGKHASQLDPGVFEQHHDQWHQELQVLAQHGVLPHLLVVFGLPSWPTAWQAFCPSPAGTRSGLAVRNYQTTRGPSQHRANRISIELGDDQEHELLLVRLRHPSGRTPIGSPSWLLRQPDFRALVGLPTLP